MKVTLPPLAGPLADVWPLFFQLADDRPRGWIVVGSQMVILHAAAHGVARPTATEDADVIVDVRELPTTTVAGWLSRQGFELGPLSPDGVGHRFRRGGITIDLLAIDHVDASDLTTIPPARTIAVPGGRRAMGRTQWVEVTTAEGHRGAVPLPDWLGALLLKARAATIASTERPKHLQDFALLLGLTDPESRIMKTSDGPFHQCYNAQAVVDEAHQVIAATDLTAQAADTPHLPGLLAQTIANVGTPARCLADAGYWSEANHQALCDAETDGCSATGRLKHNEDIPAAPRGPIPKDATPKQRMARKLRTKKRRAVYARRKVIPEPVFGQMKTLQGAGQLLLRGHNAARAEWLLHATVHNLRTLAAHRHNLPQGTRGPTQRPTPGPIRALLDALTPRSVPIAAVTA